MKYYIYIFLFIFLFSCRNEQQDEAKIIKFTEFPETVNVRCQVKPFAGVKAASLFFTKDYLVINQAWIEQGYFLKFYDKESLKFLGQTAGHGRGPGELVLPQFCSVNSNENMVYLVDQGRNRDIFEIDIEKAVNSTDYKPQKLFEIGNEKEFVNNFMPAGDSKFVTDFIQVSPDSTDYLYTLLNRKGQMLDAFGTMPFERNVPRQAYANYTIKRTILKNNKLITAFMYDDKIVCYNLNTKRKIFETDGPDLVETEIEVHSDMWVAMNHKKTYTYMSITASDEYIFALYSGYSRTVYEESNPYGFDRVFVFDFNGNPVKCLKLDESVSDIAYDEDNNSLLGIKKDTTSGMKTLGLAYIHLDDYGL